MGAIGDQHDVAMTLPAMLMVRLDQHESSDLTVCARRWLQRHTLHARDLSKILLHLVDELDGSLSQTRVLQGMDASESRQRGHILIDLGIVFHRARTERVEPTIHTKVALREMRVVAYHLNLAHLRQWRRLRAQQL